MALKKITRTAILAEKLERWVKSNGIGDDPYLSQFIEALRTNKNLHVWADIDPLSYLPYVKASSGDRRSSIIRFLTLLRNVLVFAPVALTWAAVGQATTAFARYTEENQNSVTNFLDFWQNGYGYLSDKWKISAVAEFDFILIMIVIVLTVFVSLASHRLQAEKQAEEKALDIDRAALALEIALVIHDKRKITPLNMNQSVAGSISRLVTATRNLEAAAKEIRKATRA